MDEQARLRWHYGPTKVDPDPGKMWHYNCGGEVWSMDDGLICSKCHKQELNNVHSASGES